jgi:hypothetical protein
LFLCIAPNPRAALHMCCGVSPQAVRRENRFWARALPPADVGAPKQGAAPQRGDYATGVRRSRPTPCSQPEAPRPQARKAEGRQLRLALANACPSIAFAGGVAARGRAAPPDICGGNFHCDARTFVKSDKRRGYKRVSTLVCTQSTPFRSPALATFEPRGRWEAADTGLFCLLYPQPTNRGILWAHYCA